MTALPTRVGHTVAFIVNLCIFAACTPNRKTDGNALVAGNLVVTNVIAPAPVNVGTPATQTMAVYMTIANNGNTADTIMSSTSDAAMMTMMHRNVTHGQEITMEMMPTLALPAQATIKFRPGGTHVMLEQLQRHIVAGDSVTLSLSFKHHAPIVMRVPVVTYDALQRAMERNR